MAGFGFRPAPQVDPDELERRDATSPGPGRTGRDPTQPSNVGLLRLTKITPDDERETTDGSAESLQSVDADGFRMSWEHRLAPAAARGRWRLLRSTDQQFACTRLALTARLSIDSAPSACPRPTPLRFAND